MLVDKIRCDIISGSGGSGAVYFQKSGKPSGGDGGRGGDVYVIGNTNIYDFRKFKKIEKFEAENGSPGGRERKTGADGKDLILELPLVTKIYGLDGELIHTVDDSTTPQLLLKGGAFGRGNYYFRKGQLNTLKKTTPGKKGTELKVFLELELHSDIVFIGLPNAGKSSMLNTLTNANVKVADYPFTTLYPFIGKMGEIRLMDLPGLIKDSHKGKGIGKNYTKHLNNARAVAHFISLEEDVAKSYKLIRQELENISPVLASKPELVVLTKSDNYNEKDIQQKIKEIKKYNPNYTVVSILDDNSIHTLKSKFKEIVK